MTTPIDEALSLAISIIEEARSDDRIYEAEAETVLAALRRSPPIGQGVGGWLPIESAPKDGTIFVGCNLDQPSFGSWAMYRRVRHEVDEAGDARVIDLGGWNILHDLEPDYERGSPSEPELSYAIASDRLNTSVRYGWQALPPTLSAAPAPPVVDREVIARAQTILRMYGPEGVNAVVELKADDLRLILAALNQGGETARDHERSDVDQDDFDRDANWFEDSDMGSR